MQYHIISVASLSGQILILHTFLGGLSVTGDQYSFFLIYPSVSFQKESFNAHFSLSK